MNQYPETIAEATRRSFSPLLRRFGALVVAGLLLPLRSHAADPGALQPVADPGPALQDLQKKMSSLTSVYL